MWLAFVWWQTVRFFCCWWWLGNILYFPYNLIVDVLFGIACNGLGLTLASVCVWFPLRVYVCMALTALVSNRFRVKQVEEIPQFACLWWWLDRRRHYFLAHWQPFGSTPTDAFAAALTLQAARTVSGISNPLQELNLRLLRTLLDEPLVRAGIAWMDYTEQDNIGLTDLRRWYSLFGWRSASLEDTRRVFPFIVGLCTSSREEMDRAWSWAFEILPEEGLNAPHFRKSISQAKGDVKRARGDSMILVGCVFCDFGGAKMGDLSHASHAFMLAVGANAAGKLQAYHYQSCSPTPDGTQAVGLRDWVFGPRGQAVLSASLIDEFVDDFEVLEKTKTWTKDLADIYHKLFRIKIGIRLGRDFTTVTKVKLVTVQKGLGCGQPRWFCDLVM